MAEEGKFSQLAWPREIFVFDTTLGLDKTWRSGRQPGTHLSTNFQDNHSARGFGVPVRARRRKQKARVVLVRSVSLRASSR